MLALTAGQNPEYLYVTLNEKRTLDDGYYLFVFEHITTREIVNKIYAFSEDLSDYQTRFNKFSINTASLFTETGYWTYKVYEQASSTNTVTTGLTEVERGIMKLSPATEFAFTGYDEATTYKQYAT